MLQENEDKLDQPHKILKANEHGKYCSPPDYPTPDLVMSFLCANLYKILRRSQRGLIYLFWIFNE